MDRMDSLRYSLLLPFTRTGIGERRMLIDRIGADPRIARLGQPFDKPRRVFFLLRRVGRIGAKLVIWPGSILSSSN